MSSPGDAPACPNRNCRMPLIEYGYLERRGRELVKTTVLVCANRRCYKRFRPVAYNTTVTLEKRDAQVAEDAVVLAAPATSDCG